MELIKKINDVITERLLEYLKKMNIYLCIFFLIDIIFIVYLNTLTYVVKMILILISFLIFIRLDKFLKIRVQRNNIFKKIKKLDDENQEIFNNNNPFSEEFLRYPTEEKIKKWKSLKYKKIKPNNQKILKLLDDDLLVIPKKDKELIERYRLHLIEYDLFLNNGFNSNYKTYPEEIKKIIKKYGDD